MKRNDRWACGRYIAPECLVFRIEPDASILTSSPLTWENDIKDPTWNTDGNYGLE